jgi:hypothetical protein
MEIEDGPGFVNNLQNHIAQLRMYVLAYDSTLRGVVDDAGLQLYPHSHVFLKQVFRKGLAPKWVGPYRVTDYRHPVLTIVKEGEPYKVNVDRVKGAYGIHENVPEMVEEPILDEHFMIIPPPAEQPIEPPLEGLAQLQVQLPRGGLSVRMEEPISAPMPYFQPRLQVPPQLRVVQYEQP